jgi:hypothetical protein
MSSKMTQALTQNPVKIKFIILPNKVLELAQKTATVTIPPIILTSRVVTVIFLSKEKMTSCWKAVSGNLSQVFPTTLSIDLLRLVGVLSGILRINTTRSEANRLSV